MSEAILWLTQWCALHGYRCVIESLEPMQGMPAFGMRLIPANPRPNDQRQTAAVRFVMPDYILDRAQQAAMLDRMAMDYAMQLTRLIDREQFTEGGCTPTRRLKP